MEFTKIAAEYTTRECPGQTVFGINSGGVTPAAGWPEPSFINANSWHHALCPIPAEATHVLLDGMFVGGVTTRDPTLPFFLHLDFHDPDENPPVASAADWKARNNVGSMYYYFYNPNHRIPFGTMRRPVRNSRLLLRWKIDVGGGASSELNQKAYQNAFGINLWCQGYAVAQP